MNSLCVVLGLEEDKNKSDYESGCVACNRAERFLRKDRLPQWMTEFSKVDPSLNGKLQTDESSTIETSSWSFRFTISLSLSLV